MAENKTRATPQSVAEFIAGVEPAARRDDAVALVRIMEEEAGEPATMWGPSIVGFGRYRYRYESGREGEASLAAFSPRKANMVLYLSVEEPERSEMLVRLGKHKSNGGCVYLNRLADVDEAVLRRMVRMSVETLKARYPD